MSCFWRGLLECLKLNELNETFGGTAVRRPVEFAKLLKNHNTRTPHVTWQGEKLSEKQMDENVEAIRDYNISHVNSGYWCSTCDPMMCLVCEIFRVDIDHKFLRTMIRYRYVGENPRNRLIKCGNNRGHFWGGRN